MQVRNKSKRTILIDDVRVAKTLTEKTIGLLKSKTPEVLFLKTRFGIHTFSMKYAIDVIILDKHNTVVKLKASLAPNSIFLWNPRYDSVLEFPEGIIEKAHIAVGDVIELT